MAGAIMTITIMMMTTERLASVFFFHLVGRLRANESRLASKQRPAPLVCGRVGRSGRPLAASRAADSKESSGGEQNPDSDSDSDSERLFGQEAGD